jgi:hypothetical protein
MGVGEMSVEAFTSFLQPTLELKNLCSGTAGGTVENHETSRSPRGRGAAHQFVNVRRGQREKVQRSICYSATPLRAARAKSWMRLIWLGQRHIVDRVDLE